MLKGQVQSYFSGYTLTNVASLVFLQNLKRHYHCITGMALISI